MAMGVVVTRSTERRGSFVWAVALSVGVLVMALSCAGERDPVAGHGGMKALVVESEVDVAALELRGLVDPEALTFVGLVTPRQGALAWPYVAPEGDFVVGLIAARAMRGEVVALVFEERVAGASAALVSSVAYDERGTPIPDASVRAAWIAYDGAALHAPDRVASALDAELVEQGVQVHGYR